MLPVIAALAIVAAIAATLIGGVYHLCCARYVRLWFGEESRRDHDARQRRQSFEWRCAQVLTWAYIAGVFGFLREALPELSSWALGAQIVAFVISVLFAWGATVRFRDPLAE